MKLTFGYAIRDARAIKRNALVDFATHLGRVTSVEIVPEELESYDALTQRLHRRELDIAWVPPLPLVALVRANAIVPIATLHRDQLVHYRSAVLVASGSRLKTLDELAGLRAAWVDPHSAAGYVLARIELARRGMGRGALGLETFLGSHDAVVNAVATKRADFGATFARITRDGAATGSWSEGGLDASVQALATFGEIPPDALAFRTGLDDAAAIRTALVDSLGDDVGRSLVKRAFAADDLRPFEDTLYETFRDAVFRAYESGVLNASAVLRAVSSDPDATTQHTSIVPAAPATLPELPKDEETE